MESQFPDWIRQFLLGDRGARSGLLQRDEMHAQLQELENKILTKMAEMQGKSAREAAASLGQILQKEGIVGVTEEVRDDCSPNTLPLPWKSHTASSSCVLGHDRPSWLEVQV